MVNPPPQADWRVEEVWEQRVRAAKMWYDLAIAEVQALSSAEDGINSELWRAKQIEESARKEYAWTLETFASIVIHGRMPDKVA
jgi:hypothetical protein